MSSLTIRIEEAGLKEMSHQTELLIQACDSPALWCKVTYIVVSHECVLFIMHAPSFFSSVSIFAQQHWPITIMVLVMMRPLFHLYPSPSPSLTGLTLNNTKNGTHFLLSVCRVSIGRLNSCTRIRFPPESYRQR